MNSYIISEIQNEFEKLNNNGEITNLTYGTQQDRVYNVLNVVLTRMINIFLLYVVLIIFFINYS